ncbi:MAG: hypothetical protein Q4C52_06030 [Eubacteriales bacterium]|nr:hypothetical protein [Eubacteriales bacterium]
MLYPFIKLHDNTEINHSEMHDDKTVDVVVEKKDKKRGIFSRAMCKLPDYKWGNVVGFNDKELERFQKLVEANSKLIMEYSKKGGMMNNK